MAQPRETKTKQLLFVDNNGYLSANYQLNRSRSKHTNVNIWRLARPLVAFDERRADTADAQPHDNSSESSQIAFSGRRRRRRANEWSQLDEGANQLAATKSLLLLQLLQRRS